MELHRFSPRPFFTSMKYFLDGRSKMRSSKAAERSCDVQSYELLKRNRFHDVALADWSYVWLLRAAIPVLLIDVRSSLKPHPPEP